MGRLSREHREMLKWLENHETSLEEKYDLENAPRPKKKKKEPLPSTREPEDVIDLHGLTVESAAAEMRAFILTSKLRGYYLIKIIHGKGLHSAGEAKLKSFVLEYLNGEGKKMISSWQHAPVRHGGDGAVMIYL